MSICACGCGRETPLYSKTDPRIGAVKGQPARFIKGHRVRNGTAQEIIDDVKRVLAITESREFPYGDLRGTTYFSAGMGKFCRDTIYIRFGNYAGVLECIFPDGIFSQNQKNQTVVESVREYKYVSRTCLNCDKAFMSWGPENRKCEHCLRLPSHLKSEKNDESYELCIPGLRGTLS